MESALVHVMSDASSQSPYYLTRFLQVSLTSVRVSWRGLLQREDCADSLLVKYYKRDNTNDFGMSNELSVSTNSYIIRDVVPNIPYTFQVSISV